MKKEFMRLILEEIRKILKEDDEPTKTPSAFRRLFGKKPPQPPMVKPTASPQRAQPTQTPQQVYKGRSGPVPSRTDWLDYDPEGSTQMDAPSEIQSPAYAQNIKASGGSLVPNPRTKTLMNPNFVLPVTTEPDVMVYRPGWSPTPTWSQEPPEQRKKRMQSKVSWSPVPSIHGEEGEDGDIGNLGTERAPNDEKTAAHSPKAKKIA